MLIYTKDIALKVDKTYGYLYFIDHDHPLRSNNAGRVHYHRHVASVLRGRWITRAEVVHHKDENRQNNSLDNLEILTRSAHARHHHKPPAPSRVVICAKCAKEFTTSVAKQRLCSRACRSKLTITKTDLAALLARLPVTAVAEQLGVSDNAIRKRCLAFELPARKHPRGHWLKTKPPFAGKRRGPRNGLVHGTRGGYVHYKCRCDSCAKANSSYSQRLVARSRAG